MKLGFVAVLLISTLILAFSVNGLPSSRAAGMRKHLNPAKKVVEAGPEDIRQLRDEVDPIVVDLDVNRNRRDTKRKPIITDDLEMIRKRRSSGA